MFDTIEKEIEQNTHHLEQLMRSCLREVFEKPVITEVSNSIEASSELSMAAEDRGVYKKKGRK